MSSEFQTVAALAIVVITVAWLIARAVAKRQKPGCGGECACPTEKLKR